MMSKEKTQPDEKGFFKKIAESVGEFWDGTKDKVEEVKQSAGETMEDFKENVKSKKTSVAKKASIGKAAVAKKSNGTANAAKKETAELKKAAKNKEKALTPVDAQEKADHQTKEIISVTKKLSGKAADKANGTNKPRVKALTKSAAAPKAVSKNAVSKS